MPGDGLELRCWRTRQVSARPGKQDLEVKRGGAQHPAPWQRVKYRALECLAVLGGGGGLKEIPNKG